jgi:hypothetical protein
MLPSSPASAATTMSFSNGTSHLAPLRGQTEQANRAGLSGCRRLHWRSCSYPRPRAARLTASVATFLSLSELFGGVLKRKPLPLDNLHCDISVALELLGNVLKRKTTPLDNLHCDIPVAT